MKLLGLLLLCTTIGFVLLKYDALSLWSAGMGAAVASAGFTLLTAVKSPVQTPPSTPSLLIENSWEFRYQELKQQTAEAKESFSHDMQKLQQKLMRAEERCQSYQKLVDVHQSEIEKLRNENQHLGESVIQKERKINALKMAKLEPDLFDSDKRNTEVAYRELKKQFEEKSQMLDQTRSRLFQVEGELLAFQKEKEELARRANPSEMTLIEQLRQSEDDKRRLEAELVSLQQLVSELSLPDEETF